MVECTNFSNMDNILGRKHFVSETANLFTDEKTANAREKVISWMNDLCLANAQEKCDLLAKIQEIILSSCPELIEEFMENILSHAHDSNVDVRKQVVVFIEQLCKIKIDFLPQVINIVSMLVRDKAAQVVKRTIQACGSIYRNGLQWICGLTEFTDSIEQAWTVLSMMKAQILDLIDNDNDGIRTNAIKFLEGIVILQTYPDEDSHKKENDFSLEDVPENLKMIKRKKLEDEALYIFDILLRFHAATHISSVNLITCTGSLCAIAKLRPSFMGPVVDAIKQLNSNLPPTLTDSQVNSVRKFAKMQLLGLLKNKGAFEFQSIIRNLLLDLGSSQGEIQRSIPKMDKQEQLRRQKRILENTGNTFSKRIRLESEQENEKQTMEIDVDELEKQYQKCARVNEKFIGEHLRSTNIATSLVLEFLPQLPSSLPAHFVKDYAPVRDIPQLVTSVAKLLGEQMARQKIGPGAAAITKDPPMRPAKLQQNQPQQPQAQQSVEPMSVDETSNDSNRELGVAMTDDQLRKEEATKKLRENMERVKGEQELIERMKARAKTLKLQEVTKPFSRTIKEKFLLESVKRILNSERQCTIGGVASKRRKILAAIATSHPEKVRYLIFDFIMQDPRQRIDLAFSWLYEEYCLQQGFTRHSYVKTEQAPDYAYNELMSKLVTGISENCEFKEKITLLRKIYIDSPILPDVAVEKLTQLCLIDELSQHCLELVKELTLLRSPCRNKLIQILFTFAVHESIELRDHALQLLVDLYTVHKVLPARIEEFAMEWAQHLEKEIPPSKIFSPAYGRTDVELTWREETTKICLTILLTLLPHNPELFMDKLLNLFNATSTEIKRTIMRSMDSAITKLGPEHPILLKYIEDCPKGCETFIIRMIYALNDSSSNVSSVLVSRVRDFYAKKVKDVRVLVPVIGGLTKSEILNALPNILKLNPPVVREAFNRLLRLGPYAKNTVAVTPTDVLVSLHTIDLTQCDLKYVIKGTSLCLAEKEIYTQEVLIGVLQQLVDIVPIPKVLMRTIMQSLSLYPKMSGFVLSLLQRLILKQVWKDSVIWEGFLKCIQRMKPNSMPVMLHLPGPHLMAALQQCPDLRQPLLEYAESVKDEPMSGITPQIMDIISGRAVDVFVTDETGGYITVDKIKKEAQDTPPASGSDPGQPLPPGED